MHFQISRSISGLFQFLLTHHDLDGSKYPLDYIEAKGFGRFDVDIIAYDFENNMTGVYQKPQNTEIIRILENFKPNQDDLTGYLGLNIFDVPT